tara:strand:+ start:393 stop:947 length:555 start_codon:yes stop_codon:yes gene_type:complete
MTSLFEDSKKAIQELEGSGDDRLKAVGAFCEQLETVRKKITAREEEVKKLKEQEFTLENESIPTLLDEIGMKAVTLSSGSKVEIKEDYYAHISEENKAEAHEWLRKNGFDDIIKNDIICRFGRGQEAVATNLLNKLTEAGDNPIQKSEIHWSTLRAFVKEQIQKGSDIPQDKFGVYVTNKVKIT